MKNDQPSEQGTALTMVGVTCCGLLGVGVASFVLSLVAMAAKSPVGMGLCLIASALSLGFLINAITRK